MSIRATPERQPARPCPLELHGEVPDQRSVAERPGQRVAAGRLEQGGRLAGEPALGGAEDQEQQHRGDDPGGQGHEDDIAPDGGEPVEDGPASRQMPTTARTCLSAITGRYSRSSGRRRERLPGPRFGRVLGDERGLGRSGHGEAKAPATGIGGRPGTVVGGEDRAIGQAQLYAEDLASARSGSPAAPRGAQLGGRRPARPASR